MDFVSWIFIKNVQIFLEVKIEINRDNLTPCQAHWVLQNLLLGVAKDEHFSCFLSSCQLGLRANITIHCSWLFSTIQYHTSILWTLDITLQILAKCKVMTDLSLEGRVYNKYIYEFKVILLLCFLEIHSKLFMWILSL